MGRAHAHTKTLMWPRSLEAVEVNEWPAETTLDFAVGLALQEEEPLPGIENLLRRIGQHLGEPKLGLKRAVFTVNEKWVLKVPLTWEGDTDNEREAKHDDKFIPLARARAHHSLPSGVLLLWMERVCPQVVDLRTCPSWVHAVDCQQVGLTADGRLVAYDL